MAYYLLCHGRGKTCGTRTANEHFLPRGHKVLDSVSPAVCSYDAAQRCDAVKANILPANNRFPASLSATIGI